MVLPSQIRLPFLAGFSVSYRNTFSPSPRAQILVIWAWPNRGRSSRRYNCLFMPKNRDKIFPFLQLYADDLDFHGLQGHAGGIDGTYAGRAVGFGDHDIGKLCDGSGVYGGGLVAIEDIDGLAG